MGSPRCWAGAWRIPAVKCPLRVAHSTWSLVPKRRGGSQPPPVTGAGTETQGRAFGRRVGTQVSLSPGRTLQRSGLQGTSVCVRGEVVGPQGGGGGPGQSLTEAQDEVRGRPRGGGSCRGGSPGRLGAGAFGW